MQQLSKDVGGDRRRHGGNVGRTLRVREVDDVVIDHDATRNALPVINHGPMKSLKVIVVYALAVTSGGL